MNRSVCFKSLLPPTRFSAGATLIVCYMLDDSVREHATSTIERSQRLTVDVSSSADSSHPGPSRSSVGEEHDDNRHSVSSCRSYPHTRNQITTPSFLPNAQHPLSSTLSPVSSSLCERTPLTFLNLSRFHSIQHRLIAIQ